MFPGVKGVGSGVGIKVEDSELQLCIMYRSKDEKVFQSIWPIWKTFLQNAVGVCILTMFCLPSQYIYVIKGGAEDLKDERSELLDIHTNAFTNVNAPLLIFVMVDDTQEKAW